MEIKFADTFAQSLKRMVRHEKWYYKILDFFRYELPWFFRNLWAFRKAIWRHRPWDYSGTLRLMHTSLTLLADNIEKYGNEVEISRDKKVAAMRRAIQIIGNIREDNYIEMAEAELGEIKSRGFEFEPTADGNFTLKDDETDEEREHNLRVYDRSHELEEADWNELWTIIKGQDHEEYRKLIDAATEEEKRKRDLYYDWFDGSGMRGWWD